MGHEFDVTRPTGTSFKQPKRTSARTTPDVDPRECGQCTLSGSGNRAGGSEREPTLHALGLAS